MRGDCRVPHTCSRRESIRRQRFLPARQGPSRSVLSGVLSNLGPRDGLLHGFYGAQHVGSRCEAFTAVGEQLSVGCSESPAPLPGCVLVDLERRFRRRFPPSTADRACWCTPSRRHRLWVRTFSRQPLVDVAEVGWDSEATSGAGSVGSGSLGGAARHGGSCSIALHLKAALQP